MTETYRHRVGTTDDRGYVVVDVTISVRSGEHETVTHETVTDPVRVSITGEHYERGDRRGDPSRAGQCRESLAEVTRPAAGWTLAEVRELAEIWDRWHLNDMRAACAHMVPGELAREDNGYGGQRISTRDPRNVCPVTGYKYGHAWLVEPVPAEVLERLRHLMRDRGDALYRERGYGPDGKPYPAGGAQ